jgi:hypothetical protein
MAAPKNLTEKPAWAFLNAFAGGLRQKEIMASISRPPIIARMAESKKYEVSVGTEAQFLADQSDPQAGAMSSPTTSPSATPATSPPS